MRLKACIFNEKSQELREQNDSYSDKATETKIRKYFSPIKADHFGHELVNAVPLNTACPNRTFVLTMKTYELCLLKAEVL